MKKVTKISLLAAAMLVSEPPTPYKAGAGNFPTGEGK